MLTVISREGVVERAEMAIKIRHGTIAVGCVNIILLEYNGKKPQSYLTNVEQFQSHQQHVIVLSRYCVGARPGDGGRDPRQCPTVRPSSPSQCNAMKCPHTGLVHGAWMIEFFNFDIVL